MFYRKAKLTPRDGRPWSAQLRAECRARGLPARYVERLLEEFNHHLEDCTEAAMPENVNPEIVATERLGPAAALADQAAREFRRRAFAGRHRVLAFLVLPVILLISLLGGSLFLLVSLVRLIRATLGDLFVSGDAPSWLVQSVPIVLVGILPAAICGWLFCRLASRSAVSWRWPCATAALLAIVGGTAVNSIKMPGPVQTYGTIELGWPQFILEGITLALTVSSDDLAGQIYESWRQTDFMPRTLNTLHGVQLAIPMLFCAWALWRRRACWSQYPAAA